MSEDFIKQLVQFIGDDVTDQMVEDSKAIFKKGLKLFAADEIKKLREQKAALKTAISDMLECEMCDKDGMRRVANYVDNVGALSPNELTTYKSISGFEYVKCDCRTKAEALVGKKD